LQADRDGLDRFVADVLQLHEVDDFFDDAPVCDFLPFGPDPVEQRSQRAWPHVDVPAEQDVVQYAQPLEQRQVLEGAGDAESGNRGGRRAGDVAPPQAYPALVRGIEAGHDVDHGGLAGAVRSDQAEDLAAPDREIDALQSAQAAERPLDTET
jgi:hypothetical protein